jgi:hypothetical protein
MPPATRVSGGTGISSGWDGDDPKFWGFVRHCLAMDDEVEIDLLPNGKYELTIAFSDREDE